MRGTDEGGNERGQSPSLAAVQGAEEKPTKKYGKGPTKLADGRYQAKVKLANGARVSVYGKSKRECQEAANNLRRDVEAGKPKPDKRLTLKRYLIGPELEDLPVPPGQEDRLHGWLGDVARISVRPRVYQRYEEIVRLHILPELGGFKLAELTADDVQSLYAKKGRPKAEKGDGLSPNTVRRIHEVLHNALQRAVATRRLTSNACDAVIPPRVSKERLLTLTPDLAVEMLVRVKGDPIECPVTLALTTGLREAEILGLKWGDVDLEEGTIQVARQVQRVKGQGIQEFEPKSSTSRRSVALTPQGRESLERQRVRVAGLHLAAGERWDERDLVHPNRLGRPIEAGNFYRRWKRFFVEMGLDDLRFHDLRHSVATLLRRLKVPIRDVQEILGHSSIKVTSDLYTHEVPDSQREAMERLGALLRPDNGHLKRGKSSRKSSHPLIDFPAMQR